MHAYLFLSLFLLFAASISAASTSQANDRPLDPESLFEASAYWPVRVALLEDWSPAAPDARTIPEGRQGVLIRLEEAEEVLALVDFNRLRPPPQSVPQGMQRSAGEPGAGRYRRRFA